MRLLILSDLHLEASPLPYPEADCDAIILAGDIDHGTAAVDWADELSKRLGAPAVLVAGNHEFHNGRPDTMRTHLLRLRESAAGTGGRVTFLENESATIEGVRFLGCTLWTDFEAIPDGITAAKAHARRTIADFSAIDYRENTPLTPDHAADLCRGSQAFLEAALAEPFPGHSGVVTHHPPSLRPIPEAHRRHPLTPSFASVLDDVVDGSGAALWIHGHLHKGHDYRIGGTRLVANPRGTFGRKKNPNFNPTCIVDLPIDDG